MLKLEAKIKVHKFSTTLATAIDKQCHRCKRRAKLKREIMELSKAGK